MIAATFFLFSNGSVLDLLLRSVMTGRNITYPTKSNTETLLPTGLSTEFPSGVNATFPCVYTAPHKFWKAKLAFIAVGWSVGFAVGFNF